ncbi:CoB--CoM heterodisulfide reductase iron-sulfur subunit A family protein, partial [Aduncisulcus paluster]
MLSASGPTEGHIKRPSDGKEPKTWSSSSQAILTKDHCPDSQSYVFYMDIRSPGKMFDEFTRRAQEEYEARYIRGRVSMVYPKGDKLV